MTETRTNSFLEKALACWASRKISERSESGLDSGRSVGDKRLKVRIWYEDNNSKRQRVTILISTIKLNDRKFTPGQTAVAGFGYSNAAGTEAAEHDVGIVDRGRSCRPRGSWGCED